MATRKGKVPAKRGSPTRKARTDKELKKLGTAVAKAANSLQKSGPSAARIIRVPGCLAEMPPWCLPTQDIKGKQFWIEIRPGKKPRP